VAESPLAYVTSNLATIAELGANVLYLCPPYPIGVLGRKGIGSPYSSSNFMAVEPEYGTLDEIKAFISRAHEFGFKVIFDITPNHTSRDHVWTKSNPDYYVHDDNGELFYDFDWSDVAKLDYHNPELRQAMTGVFDFWLSILGEGQGIDGFRLDMAHMISDLSCWDEAMEELRQRYDSRTLLFLAECYGTANNIDLFKRGINAAYDDDFYKICQYLYAVDGGGNSIVHESADAQYNGDFADKLEAYRGGGIAAAVLRALNNYEENADLCAGCWVARYTDNHDEGRGLHRFGAGAVRAINQLLFMSPHCIPFILTGQEFGAVNRPSIHERMAVCDKGPTVIDNGETRVVAGVEFEGNLFSRSCEERQEWYHFYKELIALRKSTPEFCNGSFAVLDTGGDTAQSTVVAFERELDGSVVRCAVNLGSDSARVANADLFAGEIIYGSLNDGVLAPFEAVAVRI
jgi:glycosidase